jgi:hypothetical protein
MRLLMKPSLLAGVLRRCSVDTATSYLSLMRHHLVSLNLPSFPTRQLKDFRLNGQ